MTRRGGGKGLKRRGKGLVKCAACGHSIHIGGTCGVMVLVKPAALGPSFAPNEVRKQRCGCEGVK